MARDGARDERRNSASLGRRVTLVFACALVLLASVADAAAQGARLGAGPAGGEHGPRAVSAATDAGRPDVRLLATGATLMAEVRESFLAAYRAANPGADVHVRVIGPRVSEAGVLLGATPVEDTTWVVAAVCANTVVACQDAGAFSLFERTGTEGAFHDLGFAPCLVPLVLAQRWYPGGHYPMGASCPAGNELVARGGLRSDGWTALVPRSWTRCLNAPVSLAHQLLCSFLAGDTDKDVWYDPANPREWFAVVTCRGGGCWALGPSGPKLSAPPGVTVTGRPSKWELTFHSRGVAGYLGLPTDGAGETSGLLLAARLGSQLTFPIYTVAASLPASEAELASVMADSFATPS